MQDADRKEQAGAAGRAEKTPRRRVQQGDQEAADRLALEHHDEVRHLVARMAHGTGLGTEDVEDAQQDVFLVVRGALAHYDPGRLPPDSTCCLGRYVRGVARLAFRRWLGQWRRGRSRAQRVGQERARLRLPGAEGTCHWLQPPPEWQDEPSLAAQGQEGLAALAERVNHLDESRRQLWLGLCAGHRAAVLARRLGCAPRTVRRRSAQLVDTLHAELGEDY